MVTPSARPFDIAEIFPELWVLAKPATRLHPRRGEPSINDSSIGGPLLWPAGEPWPTCDLPRMVKRQRPITPAESQHHANRMEQHRALRERLLADPNIPDELKASTARFNESFEAARAEAEPPRVVTTWPVEAPAASEPMVALLQLHASDAPSISFPDGTDLMQLLWCPQNHTDVPANPHHLGPVPFLVWRRAADVKDILEVIPPPADDAREGSYLPLPCVLSPEQVTEYPDIKDLPGALRDRVKAWSEDCEARTGISYRDDLSTAPGWKVGGWPSWYQDAFPLLCECGADMALLMRIASGERGGRSWRPQEDRHFPDKGIEGIHVVEPTDVIVGRQGDLHLFRCPRDHRHPLQMVTQ
jgi:hypothetical protein